MSPELTTWLEQHHLWLQIAVERLLANSRLSNTDIAECAEIIKDFARVARVNSGVATPT